MPILSYRLRHLLDRALVVPRWSTLRALGQSWLLALTVLIPFLGSLILFNQQLVDLLLLSPTVVGRWVGESGQEAIEASRRFTLSRVQIAYFGLSFLGVASFLFAVVCPAEVKANATITEYIETEKPLITNARRRLLISKVAEDCLLNEGEEEAWGPQFLRRLAYPPELWALFHSVFTEIAEIVNIDELDPQTPFHNGWGELGVG